MRFAIVLLLLVTIVGVYSVQTPLFVDNGPFISDFVRHHAEYEVTAANFANYIKAKIFPDIELSSDDGVAP